MFKNQISSTALTTPAANDFFSNVSGDDFQRDCTFLSTLRALIAPRMKENDTISFLYTYVDPSSSQLSALSVERAVRFGTDAIRTTEYNDNLICLTDFRNYDPDANHQWVNMMEANFEKHFPGWLRLEKFTLFFRKKFNVLCFINPELRSVQIFTEMLTLKNYHHLQCAIFAFLPWYFDPSAGVSALEMELVNSLKEKTSDQYEDCINRIAEQYDFRSLQIKKLLANFETRYERIKLRDEKERLDRINRDLDNLQNQIRECLRKKAGTDLMILGLEEKINRGGSGESEIMDYFLRNKRLILRDVDDTQMTFIATGYLMYFDEDAAKRAIENRSSRIYMPNGSSCESYIPAEDMELLLRAVFLEQRIRIRVCAAYKLYLSEGCEGIARYNYGYDCKTFTPNPHIDGYHCLGNYRQAINDLLRDRRYLEAIEQCVASCSSLNFCDPTVLGDFAKRIYGIADPVNMRCFELPDGSIVKPKEAIEFLKKEAAANG